MLNLLAINGIRNYSMNKRGKNINLNFVKGVLCEFGFFECQFMGVPPYQRL